jgi:hypothetical protein
MSCDWDIYCKTCDDNHGFSDANHQEELMWSIIDHAKEISDLALLVTNSEEVRLISFYGPLSPNWFVKHLGHELVTRNEYGEFGCRK